MNKHELKYFDENENECLPEKAKTIISHIYDESGKLIEETIYVAPSPKVTQHNK